MEPREKKRVTIIFPLDVKAGEKPGYPRFQGHTRFHSFTYPQYDNGARCDNGFLVLSKIGVRWSRPLEGTPKTVTIAHEADGWYVCFSCAEVPCQELPKTGNAGGLQSRNCVAQAARG